MRYRVVIHRPAPPNPAWSPRTIESLRDGVEVRVAESLPIKLILADAELALVPLTVTPGEEPGAVLLHRAGLLTAMDALFEIVRRLRAPARRRHADGGTVRDAQDLEADAPTALDREILALLLAGLTDQAVATQLDLSLRTLQRHLRHLMDIAGVQSRMQLGWYAARHDWA